MAGPTRVEQPAKDVVVEHLRTPVAGAGHDVVVCGGGPAGAIAAISAARAGARTLLLESEGCLGGVWTSGLLTLVLDSGSRRGVCRLPA